MWTAIHSFLTFSTVSLTCKNMKSVILWTFLVLASLHCAVADEPKSAALQKPTTSGKTETITLGAGCFWCTEAVFQQIPGVISVMPGYIGGTVKNPTYQQVCTGRTGHAEVARIVYDPTKVTLDKILETFWHVHDPTSLNRQGADAGIQYRSAIFYETDEQRAIAEKSKKEASKDFDKPIVTEITKAPEFYAAEDYHQNYYRLNKNKPYCRAVIAPKLRKAGLKE